MKIITFGITLAMLAQTAAGQWIACTNQSNINQCTLTSAVGVGTQTPQRNLAIVGAGSATVQVAADSSQGSTASRGFQLQQVGLNSYLINEESGSLSFWTSAASRMTIDVTGHVGVGTTSPTARLEVQGAQGSEGISLINLNPLGIAYVSFGETGGGSTPFWIARQGSASATYPRSAEIFNSDAAPIRFGTSNIERVRIDETGNVGIGTTSPGTINGNTWSGTILNLSSGNVARMGIQGSGFAGIDLVDRTAPANQRQYTISSNGGQLRFYAVDDSPNGIVKVVMDSAGRVGIGTATPTMPLDVNGNANVSGSITVGGNINAKYQDVAEWVPTLDALEPGTVVVLDRRAPNSVTASTSAYDTGVAGVVSEHPGITLGEPAANKAVIATSGRVRVRVEATRPIAIGDLLVTGEAPGVAMKSEPITMNGRSFHQPGTIIGKALQPLAKGRAEILVLLTLQ